MRQIEQKIAASRRDLHRRAKSGAGIGGFRPDGTCASGPAFASVDALVVVLTVTRFRGEAAPGAAAPRMDTSRTANQAALAGLRFENTSISVIGLARTSAWYWDVLGFEEVRTREFPSFGARFDFLKGHGMQIELISTGKSQMPETQINLSDHLKSTGYRTLVLNTSDLSADLMMAERRTAEAHAALTAAGDEGAALAQGLEASLAALFDVARRIEARAAHSALADRADEIAGLFAKWGALTAEAVRAGRDRDAARARMARSDAAIKEAQARQARAREVRAARVARGADIDAAAAEARLARVQELPDALVPVRGLVEPLARDGGPR